MAKSCKLIITCIWNVRSLWVYQIWWIWRSYPFTQNLELPSFQSSLQALESSPHQSGVCHETLQSIDDPKDCQSSCQHPSSPYEMTFLFQMYSRMKPTSCILDFVLEAWTLMELTVHDVEWHPADASSSLAIQFCTLFSRTSDTKVTLDEQTQFGGLVVGVVTFCTVFSQISFQPKLIPHSIGTLMWGDLSTSTIANPWTLATFLKILFVYLLMMPIVLIQFHYSTTIIMISLFSLLSSYIYL